MLEDPDVVDEKIAQVNDIFQKSLTQSKEKTESLSWDLGVMQRAYYVTGAFMAKRIDEELGRAGLVETIASGPLSFVDTYNEIASENQKIFQFEKPDRSSLLIRIKEAALNKELKSLKKELSKALESDKDRLVRELNLLGFKMYHAFENREAAIELFALACELLPDSDLFWDSKGKIHFMIKEYENSRQCYQEALRLNPDSATAPEMLQMIEQAVR